MFSACIQCVRDLPTSLRLSTCKLLRNLLTVSAGPGIWIVLPSWTKNWDTLFDSKRVTTLQYRRQDHIPIHNGGPDKVVRGPGLLQHLRELLASIDCLALAVEIFVSHPVGVVVTTVGVAFASKTILRVGPAARVFLADVICVFGARVRRQRERVRVALPVKHGEVSHGRGLSGPRIRDLPDVDFGATTAVGSNACVGIVCRGSPALHVGLECGVSDY